MTSTLERIDSVRDQTAPANSTEMQEPHRLERFIDAACALVGAVLVCPLVRQLALVQEADAAYRRDTPSGNIVRQVLDTAQPLSDVPLVVQLLQVTYNNLQVVLFTAFLLSYHNYMNLWLRKTDRWTFLSGMAFCCIAPLWSILVRSIVDGGFPSPYSLLSNGILWIGISLILILTHAWTFQFNTNPAFAQSKYHFQFILSFSGMILAGALFIIVGATTISMLEPVPGATQLLRPTSRANLIIALTVYPGFWLPFILSLLMWFLVKIPALNGTLPSGWDLRYSVRRFETFTNSVVAFAGLVLAQEFPVPLDISLAEFQRRIPDLFLFAMTASIILFHWYYHARMTYRLRAIDIPMFWLNALFCFFIVTLPFALKLVFMGARTGDSGAHDVTQWYCFLILVLLAFTQAGLQWYCLKKKSCHKQDAPYHGPEAFIGILLTVLIAIIERAVAYSGWRWSVFLYGLIPALNVLVLFVIGSDHDATASHGPRSFSFYYQQQQEPATRSTFPQ